MTHDEAAQRATAAADAFVSGKQAKIVARELGVHPVTVRKWAQKFHGRKLERNVHVDLVKRVKLLGGEVRRVKWLGRAHAPDVLVMLPGRHVWVEEKRPGKEAEPGQLREHERMRNAGCTVLVIDSQEAIDRYFPLGFWG